MNKELRKTLKQIERLGFTTKDGKSHIKVFDPDGNLAIVVPHGHNRDRVPGGSDKELRKVIRRWEDR